LGTTASIASEEGCCAEAVFRATALFARTRDRLSDSMLGTEPFIRERYAAGRSQANAILAQNPPRSIQDPTVEIPRSQLPREVAHVRLNGSIDGEDRLWSVSDGGWIARITQADLQREIDRKRRIIATAREKCDTLWLVIVHNLTRGAPSELSPAVPAAVHRYDFDRVLWLESHVPRVIELR
jgi:hypothetical protein